MAKAGTALEYSAVAVRIIRLLTICGSAALNKRPMMSKGRFSRPKRTHHQAQSPTLQELTTVGQVLGPKIVAQG